MLEPARRAGVLPRRMQVAPLAVTNYSRIERFGMHQGVLSNLDRTPIRTAKIFTVGGRCQGSPDPKNHSHSPEPREIQRQIRASTSEKSQQNR